MAETVPEIAHAVGIATVVPTKLILYLRGEEPRAEIWPVALAAIAFFYLWWLTALLFDLTFVWQRYVRESAASNHLARLATE